MDKYVTYYRVSTKMQGEDGNGMKAQAEAVRNFLSSKDAEEVAFFREVESGTNSNRTALISAVQMCKEEGAALLVAKLDRLSRNVKFLFTLKEELEAAGVGFVFADNPDMANNTMVLGVMASVAQHEAEIISERTRAGIRQSDKYKRGEWGNPDNMTAEERRAGPHAKARKAREAKANRHAFHFIQPRRERGMSYNEISEALNREGYRTRNGKKFYPATVRRIHNLFAEGDVCDAPDI